MLLGESGGGGARCHQRKREGGGGGPHGPPTQAKRSQTVSDDKLHVDLNAFSTQVPGR